MPITPNVLERLLLYRLNRRPMPVLELFEALDSESATPADLAARDLNYPY